MAVNCMRLAGGGAATYTVAFSQAVIRMQSIYVFGDRHFAFFEMCYISHLNDVGPLNPNNRNRIKERKKKMNKPDRVRAF